MCEDENVIRSGQLINRDEIGSQTNLWCWLFDKTVHYRIKGT